MRPQITIKFLLLFFLFLSSLQVQAGVYEIEKDQMLIDGKPVPQLFGAELQYFRLRGGYGPNVPRAEVIKLWATALDRMVEAHMNAISFYIPWDFHEYAPGKFDFDGTVDEDGDGLPDYPSRDVKTFFKMIEQRGIKYIMVRPGPYVNAEWGFLGFGAVPLWFHLQYPDSHMKNPQGQYTKLYDYHNPDLLRHTRLYFEALYADVLKNKIGPGRPVSFLQLDNETNFMWQSLYNHDYGSSSILRYQAFLLEKYKTIAALNNQHGTDWLDFAEVKAPITAGRNYREDQDWYSFADTSVAEYLHQIRIIWENIGVHEPDVLFTLADSYNATQSGLLPNYQLHNQAGITGLLTVNLYPKTYETLDHPLLNLPFKADHDVKAAESASEAYFGAGSHWALGPEIQAGWWRGIPVSGEARQQTYLTVLGHGLKAIFVYYFNEGDNWQTDWARKQIEPLYKQLHQNEKFNSISIHDLSPFFWKSLQKMIDEKLVTGFDGKSVMTEDSQSAQKLYFDAPLAYGAVTSPHFYKLKELGEKLIAPHADWLATAVEMTDPVCILKDQQQNVPAYLAAIDSVEMNSTWGSGLIGYLLQGGINPKILHFGISSSKEIAACKIILRQDSGETSDALSAELKSLIESGRSVVNLLDNSLAKKIGLSDSGTVLSADEYPPAAQFGEFNFLIRSAPLFKYQTMNDLNCQTILKNKNENIGFTCKLGQGHFTQIGSLFYDVYNSNEYGHVVDLPARNQILEFLLKQAEVKPQIRVNISTADESYGKIVAFARKSKGPTPIWLTVKSAFGISGTHRIQVRGLPEKNIYKVQDLLGLTEQSLTGKEINEIGFISELSAFGSTVYWIE